MKKIIVIIFYVAFTILFVSTLPVWAVTTATPSATATPESSRDQQISDLKNRIATKVAELKILSKTVLTGDIKTLSDQKIIITVGDNDVNLEISEDTVFSQFDQNGNKKTLKIEDLKTGDKLVAWGTYNTETQVMTADGIVSRDLALTFTGTVKSVDKKNYQFYLTSSGQVVPYLFDVNPPTKISTLSQDNSLSKIGFSKLLAGQTVFVYGFIGTKTKDGQTLLSAQRIIVLSQPKVPNIPTSTPTITPKPAK